MQNVSTPRAGSGAEKVGGGTATTLSSMPSSLSSAECVSIPLCFAACPQDSRQWLLNTVAKNITHRYLVPSHILRLPHKL